MSGVVEKTKDYRMYDDGNCYIGHIFSIEKRVYSSHGQEVWRKVDRHLYIDYKEAHEALLREAQVKEVYVGDPCPNDIPTYTKSNHNFATGCVGCQHCYKFRGFNGSKDVLYCSNPYNTL